MIFSLFSEWLNAAAWILSSSFSGSRRRSEPDEAELLRISKRLVEDAVSRAVQQYKKETFQNGGGPNAGQPPGNADATAETKTTDVNAATDTRKWRDRTRS